MGTLLLTLNKWEIASRYLWGHYMGSTLSQGQQQRVLIARALYQRTEILILDEGTAHLDERVETQLLENVRDLVI